MNPHEAEFLNFIRPDERRRAERTLAGGSTADPRAWEDACRAIDSRFVTWASDRADVAAHLRQEAHRHDSHLRSTGGPDRVSILSIGTDLHGTEMSIGEAVAAVRSVNAWTIVSVLPGRVASVRDGQAGRHALLMRRPDIDPPSPDPARTAIARAFDDLQFERKIGAYEAWAFDDYRSEADLEKARRMDAQYAHIHWSDLPRRYVVDASNVMAFLDDESLCAFLPAFLTFLLETTFGRYWDRDSGMVEWLEYNFWETDKGRRLTPEQRAAALRYLTFEVAYETYDSIDAPIGQPIVDPEDSRVVSNWKALMRDCGDPDV